jgi:hypothetical protein
MLNFSDFINEDKRYLFSRLMRVADLIEYGDKLYSPYTIINWMRKYKFDKLAYCILVSDKPLTIKSKELLDLRVSSKDLSNKVYFDDISKNKDGYKIEGSEINLGDNEIYLWVFRKNSNDNNRARQIHGFRYEGILIKKNGLKKLRGYTDKWDAIGTLNKVFLNSRKRDGYNIEYFNGSGYDKIKSINDLDKTGLLKFRKWNIKSPKKGNNIDMADFLRIAGYEKTKNNDIVPHKNRVNYFMLALGFHNGGEIVEEYFIHFDIKNWDKYLPDMKNPLVFAQIQEMYKEIGQHKLNGVRTKESEEAWKNFMAKYSKITENSIIKFRFKRDSKGQLRIQSGISNKDFHNIILKENEHLRITKPK